MKLKMLFASLGTCMICGANAFSLFYSDAIVNKDKYSVMGVDVAHYQGVIDWNKLEVLIIIQRQFLNLLRLKSVHREQFAAADVMTA